MRLISQPAPTDEEMGWESSKTLLETDPDPDPDDGQIDWSEPLKQSDDRVMRKERTMAFRSGWKEAPFPPPVLKKSCAQVVGLRDFNNISMVYGKPPESQVHTRTNTTIVLPSEDYRYEDLPPDSLSETKTDISQLLKVPYTFIDSREMITSMLDMLATFHSEEFLLSIDLEGFDLGKRKGEIHLMQIYDSFRHHIHTIDVCELGYTAFSTPASDGQTTLEGVLQSACILKLFCDVRGDSRALFQQFRIQLRGVKDIQNIELASRRDPTGRQWRHSLQRLIDDHADLSTEQMDDFRAYKENGREICQKWGFAQFGVRPLRKDLAVYAANDVLYMPRIYNNLVKNTSVERLQSADSATQKEHTPDSLSRVRPGPERKADECCKLAL